MPSAEVQKLIPQIQAEDEYLAPFARKTADHDKIKIYERALYPGRKRKSITLVASRR